MSCKRFLQFELSSRHSNHNVTFNPGFTLKNLAGNSTVNSDGKTGVEADGRFQHQGAFHGDGDTAVASMFNAWFDIARRYVM